MYRKEKNMKTKKKINGIFSIAKRKLCSVRGDSNIIAVILIMVVVIGLCVVFRKQMGDIVSKLFTSVNTSIDGF